MGAECRFDHVKIGEHFRLIVDSLDDDGIRRNTGIFGDWISDFGFDASSDDDYGDGN